MFKMTMIRWITSKEIYRHHSPRILRNLRAKTMAQSWKVRFKSMRMKTVVFRRLRHRICQFNKNLRYLTHWTFSVATSSRRKVSSKSTWWLRWIQWSSKTWSMSTIPWMQAFLKMEPTPKVPKASQSNLSCAFQRLRAIGARSKSLRIRGSVEINTSSS